MLVIDLPYGMKIIDKFLPLIVFIFLATLSSGQQTLLRGHIYDQDSGEPIIYGNVYLEGTTYGSTSDIDGFFVLPDVPVGDYDLRVSYIGYELYSQPISLSEGNISYQRIELVQSGVKLGEVDISASRTQARTEVKISEISVTSKQIKALPSAGGEPDIAQYLQVLPGVISTGDQGGQIYIRGGSPIQNKILLDGLTIFNPFHSIGFFSVFETELVRSAEVLTGGFNAEYGGRLSAIVDIQTREGNKKRHSATLSANPFVVKALVEGPITSSANGNSTSFVLTSKKSIIDKTSPKLYDYAALNDSVGLPYDFHDSYGKLSFLSNNGSKFNVFGFNFKDKFDDRQSANIEWETTGGGLNFDLIPSNSNMILGGTVGYSKYDIALVDSDGQPRKSALKSFNVALDFTFFGSQSEFKYGFDISGIRTDFEFVNPFDIVLSQFQNTTEFSGFLKYRREIGNLIIEPSVRLQYYASLSAFSPEPRLGLKYNISDDLRFKAAGGIYTQNLISTSNERDVVNLFTGFLSGPESEVLDFDGNRLKSKLQKSTHAIAGFEYDFSKEVTVNIEGYFKDFSQLIVVNRNKLSASDPNYAIETGEAYGVDFTFQYRKPTFDVWFVYSLGNVQRYDGEQEYPTVFDRRHNVNFLSTYYFGSDADWQLSARWNLGSGFPFTKTQGFYYDNPFADGLGTDYETGNDDEVGIIYDSVRNGGRLPYYHRLDISLQKTISFSKYSSLDIIASVSNAYNRDNIFYFDRVKYDRVDQLPVIPSLGIRLKI